MRRFLAFAVIVGVIFLTILAARATAIPTTPTNLQVFNSERRILPSGANGNISAQGGNVTEVNIDAISITSSWHGYYGNISGNIRLDDANNQSFYAWGNASASGEVYASRNSSITWTQINCTNASDRSAEETYLGQAVSDGDSVTNTFNFTNHPQFFVGAVNISQDSCFSTNAFVSGAAQNTSFYQIMLSDNSSRLVYTTIVNASATGFHGETVDFQLLVGENEKPGDEGPTTYYFFVEL